MRRDDECEPSETRERVDLNREALDLAFNEFARSFELARRAEVIARRLYLSLGDYEKAIWNGHRSLELYEATDNLPERAWALNLLGGIFHDKGDTEQALSLQEPAGGDHEPHSSRPYLQSNAGSSDRPELSRASARHREGDERPAEDRRERKNRRRSSVSGTSSSPRRWRG